MRQHNTHISTTLNAQHTMRNPVCLPWLTRIAAMCMAIVALCMTTGCSTTARLGENEQLYTGVKALRYHQDSVKIDPAVKDQIFEAINVKPNNPLYSPYYRTPFPVGLWIYNSIDPDAKGFKGWIYKHFAARPVTIQRVKPATRVDMINTLLRNNGYFTSSASYTLNQGKNPKKASITYDVQVAAPYRIGSIRYLESNERQGQLIDSLARAHPYLHTGKRYCLDSLNVVRIDITNTLRNLGYYYFRPEYIQYLADSVAQRGVIDMQLVMAPDVPNQAERRYLTGAITATVQPSNGPTETIDTVVTDRMTIVRHEPVRLRNSVINSNVLARTGRPFRVSSLDRTQLALSRMGIFSSIDMQVAPRDTVLPNGDGILDLDLLAVVDKPWEVKLEVQGTSKSNSFIGPALQLGLGHNNLFGGGERLTLNLNGSYEWQTGKGSSIKNTDFNSYEVGIEATLAVPRLLAPRFVDRSRRYLNWTRFNIKANLMNRPRFFKMLQIGGGMTWEWHANKHSLNEFTPFELTYNKLLNATDTFTTTLIKNPVMLLSFDDVFIPKMAYTYTYDNDFGLNHITWRSTIAEAGHVFAGLWHMVGRGDRKTMIGTPFSQFVKAETQLIWTRRLFTEHKIVGRVYIGAAVSTSDSLSVPYREQFYVGGANSVRAFTVRTIGPGSFHPQVRDVYSYFDQTGTFKFETNWEYRFPILGYFKGAVFVDAGNIWLLKTDKFDDEFRPGGKLRMKNFFKELAVGTGVGIRFDMDMLVVRADLGIGLHLPYETSRSGWYNIPRFKDGLAFHLAIGYPF